MADELDNIPSGDEVADNVLAQYADARKRLDAIMRELGHANGFAALLKTPEWLVVKEFWEFEELRLMRQLASVRNLHLPEQQEAATRLTERIYMIRAFCNEPQAVASTQNTNALVKERSKWEQILNAVQNRILRLAGQV